MGKAGIILGAALAIVIGALVAADTDAVVESGAPSTTSSTTTSTTEGPVSQTTPPSTISATIADGGELAVPELTMDVEVAQLGEEFVRFRFRSSEPTPYTTTVSDEAGNVVQQTDGVLAAGEVKTERVEGLEAGTVYSAQATLIGPPTIESSAVLFRTTGASPDPAADAETAQVEMINLRVSELEPFHFQFDYLSNVCANGSFRIIHQATGMEVGQNNGHPNGCIAKHLGVPGKWTPPLEPSTTYVVIVTLEANGELRGRQYGNTITETLVVTTPPRDIPLDPVDRSVDPVALVGLEQMETDETTVRIDYSTNVCANTAFVVREVGGGEVGRHEGSPRGCATDHSAIPGLWTPPLEPDTTYTVVITAEADGAGSGDGNVTTESITVRTAAPVIQNTDPPPAVAIESIEYEAAGDTTDVVVDTNICATVSVLAYAQAGDVLGEAVVTGACEESSQVRAVPLAPEGHTVLVVSVDAEELAPGIPNRVSEGIVISR